MHPMRIHHNGRSGNEREFWDHHVVPLRYCLEEFNRGPDRNTSALFDALEPLAGRTVLDFACGSGVTSAWLAGRGAKVTGVDLSAGAIEGARELHRKVGVEVELLCTDTVALPDGANRRFDRLAGRYALHHVDPRAVAPVLGGYLAPGGKAAFLETMATNPLLMVARRHLVGRFGLPRFGTLDERPLGREDVMALADSLGDPSILVGEMTFLRVFDRQVLGFRSPVISKALRGLDDRMGRSERLKSLSYKQILVFQRDE